MLDGAPGGASQAGEEPHDPVGATAAPTAEEVLRARVLGAGALAAPDRGVRSRLTPATLAALTLVVVSAVASFTYVLSHGSVALPSPTDQPPAAFVTTAPSGRPATSGDAGAGSVAATPSATPVRTPTGTLRAPTPPTDRHYGETDPAISYVGSWGTASDAGYVGGAVAWTTAAGAAASLAFMARTITWYGPVGPTRGSAVVYVDGSIVATISEYAASFSARHQLFSRDFGSVGNHTIRIVASGTAGHPMIAIDELVAGS